MAILDTFWLTQRPQPQSIGVVLIETHKRVLKCSIGTTPGFGPRHDADYIRQNGARLPRRIAEGFFPQIPKLLKEGYKYDPTRGG